MQRGLITILFFITTSIAVFAQSGNDQPAIKDSGNTHLKFTGRDNTYNFGRIELNGTADCRVQFTNSGNRPLVITGMRSVPKGINSPPYKVLMNYSKNPVKPGKKGLITITIKAQGDIGSFENDIYITSNDSSAGYPILHLAGAITPVVNEPKENPKTEGPVELLLPVIKANTPP